MFGPNFELQYHQALRATFGIDEGRAAYARLVVTPSFEREFMIDLGAPQNGSAVLRCSEARSIVWKGGLTPKPAKATSRSVPIPRGVAESVHGAWLAMLGSVAPRVTNEIGFDGTTYDFAAYQEGVGIVSGRTWSPPPASPAGRLVELALRLRALCNMNESDRAKSAEEISKRASALSAEVNPGAHR